MTNIQIESTVAGIPCIIVVEEYVEGNPYAGNDIDYRGECSWTVCDRRGRYAPWLERKLTSKDEDRITNEIVNFIRR